MACCSRKQLLPEAQQAEIVPRMLVMMQESIERFRLTIAQLTDLTRLQQVRTKPVHSEPGVGSTFSIYFSGQAHLLVT